jgi:hypothetical protein
MLPQWGDRQTFLPRGLDYMGSFDLESSGFHSVTANEATLLLPRDPKTSPSSGDAEFYHVLRAATVTIGGRERNCPTGMIAYAFERLTLRPQDGLVEIAGQLVLRTDDNAAVDATYSGIARFFHPLSSFLPPQHTTNPAKPELQVGRVSITMSFDTADQRYAWLGDRQCIASGTMKLNWNAPAGADLTADSSYDIYTGS